MQSIDTMTLADIVQIISGLGATGVLTVGIWLIIKGKLLPREYVDEMKAHTEAQTKLFAKEICEGLADSTEKSIEIGVQKGVVAAVKQLNGG